jgi:hypothetical protein
MLDEPALLATAFELLNHGSRPADLREEAAPVLRQGLARLVEPHPASMLSRLQSLLAGTGPEAPFDAKELDALEALSVLTSWRETSFSRTYQEARHLLSEAGVPHAGHRAFQVAERSTGFGSALLLLRRTEATMERLSEDERRWLGRMSWRIGSRLTDTSSTMEHTVGLLLMESGAGHMRDSCSQREAQTRLDELTAAMVTLDRAALSRWPLPSLLEETRTAHPHDALRQIPLKSSR